MKGFLVLEDEVVFEGQFHGDPNWRGVGEVVFNTSLCGYQEVLTDPSYYRQIIVMTAPEQGNYGTDPQENESAKMWAEGFVCVRLNENHREGRKSLGAFLNENQRPALSGIDTRTLTLHLRDHGTPWGCILPAKDRRAALQEGFEEIKKAKQKWQGKDWVFETSGADLNVLKGEKRKGRVALIDLGTKANIARELTKRFSQVGIFSSRASLEAVLDWDPDGVVLSNGPGDPDCVDKKTVELARSLVGKKPLFGICMGHQILSLAIGGKTYKLKFGHRGGNHPVRNLETGEIYMTSQNHGYAVDPNLPAGYRVSHINLYDQTVEGIECPEKKLWSVQYHPESHPGPHDAAVLFDHFASRVTKGS